MHVLIERDDRETRWRISVLETRPETVQQEQEYTFTVLSHRDFVSLIDSSIQHI